MNYGGDIGIVFFNVSLLKRALGRSHTIKVKKERIQKKYPIIMYLGHSSLSRAHLTNRAYERDGLLVPLKQRC